uniref:Uncharacterized protein n=1 Tax=Onchocerca volvulus TaxID=6282 RepID=A0A8R1TXB2_ONCVO
MSGELYVHTYLFSAKQIIFHCSSFHTQTKSIRKLTSADNRACSTSQQTDVVLVHVCCAASIMHVRQFSEMNRTRQVDESINDSALRRRTWQAIFFKFLVRMVQLSSVTFISVMARNRRSDVRNCRNSFY